MNPSDPTQHPDTSNDDTIIGTTPEHTAIKSPDEVTAEMKADLEDLLSLAKQYHTPGSAVTDQEMATFLTLIFTQWDTTEYHSKPSKKLAEADLEDTAVSVGILAQDLSPIASPNTRSLREDRHRVRKQYCTEPRRPSPERRVWARLYVRAVLSAEAIDLELLDGKGGLIPYTASLVFDDEMSRPWMEFLAMKQLDSFYHTKLHAYNIAIAKYLARNRLQFRANGESVNTRPKDEDLELFVPYHLCRSMEVQPGSDMAEPLNRLKAEPGPSLFAGI